MEKVSSLMEKLQLSEAEKKGIWIGWSDGKKVGVVDPQAMVKLFSEKPAIEEALENSVGRVWCPLRGVECKTMGENVFLVKFLQQSGKRKAMEDGPWMFRGDALVLEEFDPRKTLEEYEFATMPVWVRVSGLPLGMLNESAGEKIGDEVGEFMEAEVVVDAVTRCRILRVKIRINIREPLWRGITIHDEERQRMESGNDQGKGQLKKKENEEGRWCPFAYEFIPDFCYTCGVIGHTDKACLTKLKRGEVQQWGPWLSWKPTKRVDWGSDSSSGSKWKGGRGRYIENFGSKNNRSSGSDSKSWRKEDFLVQEKNRKKGDDGEVTSPLKITTGQDGVEKESSERGKQLTFAEKTSEAGGPMQTEQDGGTVVELQPKMGGPAALSEPEIEAMAVSTTMQRNTPMHVDRDADGAVQQDREKPMITGDSRKGRKLRKAGDGSRRVGVVVAGDGEIGGKKRGVEEMETEEDGDGKKQKLDNTDADGTKSPNTANAGLQVQLREDK